MHELIVCFPGPLREVALLDESAPWPISREAPPAGPVPLPGPPQPSALEKEEQEALQRVLGQLSELAEELQAHERRRLEEMQVVAVELAVAIASRVVHERVEKGDYAIEALVRQAVERLQGDRPVKVFLHPLDLALVESRRQKLEPSKLNLSAIQLTADEKLGRGDCRAEAGDISVLAEVQEHLADIRRHLLETLPVATQDRRQPDRTLRRFPDRRHTA